MSVSNSTSMLTNPVPFAPGEIQDFNNLPTQVSSTRTGGTESATANPNELLNDAEPTTSDDSKLTSYSSGARALRNAATSILNGVRGGASTVVTEYMQARFPASYRPSHDSCPSPKGICKEVVTHWIAPNPMSMSGAKNIPLGMLNQMVRTLVLTGVGTLRVNGTDAEAAKQILGQAMMGALVLGSVIATGVEVGLGRKDTQSIYKEPNTANEVDVDLQIETDSTEIDGGDRKQSCANESLAHKLLDLRYLPVVADMSFVMLGQLMLSSMGFGDAGSYQPEPTFPNELDVAYNGTLTDGQLSIGFEDQADGNTLLGEDGPITNAMIPVQGFQMVAIPLVILAFAAMCRDACRDSSTVSTTMAPEQVSVGQARNNPVEVVDKDSVIGTEFEV